jgi:putative nucleotidyltransferase with HDIG domain
MNKELEHAIMTAGDLPTIPVVATRVMQMMEDMKTTADDLAKAVAADPAVAARVMKISNSAFYGCQRQIQTLSAAIVVLGYNTLKSLVVAASVKQVYKPFGLTEQMLWEHSFGAALAARIIARKTKIVNEEEAFLAGLFHDIGKIIMNSLDRDKFQILIQRCYNEDIPFTEVEKSEFPFTHDEVGAFVIKKWNFPEALTTAVLRHHDFAFDEHDDAYVVNLTAVAALADSFCKKFGIGERFAKDELDIQRTRAAIHLKFDDERMTMLLEAFQEAFERDKSFFS